MHVRHSYRPHTGVVVRDELEHWRLDDPVPGKLAEPGMLMFWFGAGLFYANASFFAEQVRTLVDLQPSPLRWLVLDARAITDLDYSAGEALSELHQDLSKAGVILALIVVPERHQGYLERTGMVELIGRNRIFESRYECVQAYRAEVSPAVADRTTTSTA
jgi:MFS superfamily sulfate permease-like transporter